MMLLAQQIELACLIEATARKPGNVHPRAAFIDLCYDDFVKAERWYAEQFAYVVGDANPSLKSTTLGSFVKSYVGLDDAHVVPLNVAVPTYMTLQAFLIMSA